jgi:alcohol dehydrogenase class IV
MKVNYLMPTRVVMDEDCLFRNRSLLADLGKKAFIVTGRSSAKHSGALDDAIRALEANGQDYAVFDRVMNNPTDVCVYEAAAECRKAGCGFVLGIGGGSPMDAAKAVAALAPGDMPRERLFGLGFTAALPVAAVPTTAGTGSETTPYAVLVDTGAADDSRFADGRTAQQDGSYPRKRSVSTPLIFPRRAFLDGRYMLCLNRDITVHTALDALSHAVEGLISVRANYLSDSLARESISMIMGSMKYLLDFPSDPASFPPEIREKLLLASAIAGMVIAQTGTTAVHSMGYQYTLNWGTDHGRANGLLLAEYLALLETKERTDPSVKPRIAGVCEALGMNLHEFAEVLNKLLVQREKATGAEIEAWVNNPVTARSAPNCYLTINRDEVRELFRRSVG